MKKLFIASAMLFSFCSFSQDTFERVRNRYVSFGIYPELQDVESLSMYGISSDVFLSTLKDGSKHIVKWPLSKMRFSEYSAVPTSRTRCESSYFKIAENVIPQQVPRIIFSDEYGLIMTYLESDGDLSLIWRKKNADEIYLGNVYHSLGNAH